MTVYGSKTGNSQTQILKSIFNTESKTYLTDYTGECDEIKFTAHIIVDGNIVEVFFNQDEKVYSAIIK